MVKNKVSTFFIRILLRCQLFFFAISSIFSPIVTLMIQSAIDGKIEGNAALNNIELVHETFTTINIQ